MSTYNAEWMTDLARKAGEIPGTSAKEKSERDARWASEWADELTVAISLREWEKATKLLEEGEFTANLFFQWSNGLQATQSWQRFRR